MPSSFDDEQRELPQLQKARQDGRVSPRQQAKAYGLKEARGELDGDRAHGELQWFADRVYVQGPGRHRQHVSSISRLVSKMDEDEDWFLGKVYGGLGRHS